MRYKRHGLALDIGCGPGVLTKVLAENHERVLAFDISPAMLAVARAETPVNTTVFQHDFTEPLTGSFDTILASLDVFNHIDDAVPFQKTLLMWYESLVPGGVFLFDLLKESYLADLIGHVETLKLDDTHVTWRIEATEKQNQIRHVLFGSEEKHTHIETAFDETTVFAVLPKDRCVESIDLPERTLYIFKK